MTITTPDLVPAATVDAYRRDGYVHVPGVLTPEEVAEAGRACRRQFEGGPEESWDGDGGNVMEWVTNSGDSSPVMLGIALHPRITRIAERLAGTSLRLFKSETIRKRVGDSSGTPLHYDAPVFPFEGEPATLTAWVALVDVTVERGCMSFLPGSQAAAAGTLFTEYDGYPYVPGPELDWAPRVAVPLRAGDCTFHDARTAHMAGANLTDAQRFSVASVYFDAATRYAPSPLAYGNSVDGMETGHPFPDDGYPLVGSAARG
jgi:phytanoyl-CoA hydroxylase